MWVGMTVQSAWPSALARRSGSPCSTAAGTCWSCTVPSGTGAGVQILELGASIPWNTCALGKVVVAFLPQSQQKDLLAGSWPG